MADFYTNLPQKEKDSLQKTIKNITEQEYVEPFEFSANDYDAAVGFFVKRNFDRQPAEEIAYVILKQAKIDSVPVTQILDILQKADLAQLNELLTIVLNANRYKSSRLGIRNTRTTKDFVSRNIRA